MTLELIPATLADRTDIYAWMTAPGVVERMMGPPDFPDQPIPDYEEFCADWKEHYFTGRAPEHGRVMLLCDGDERVGMFAYNDVVTTPDGRRACEVDMWLRGPEVCGHGLGPAGLSLLCQHLREDLDVGQAFLQPSARNPPAIRAYEKAGFVRWPDMPERAARWFSTVPDYADSVFLVRELPPARFPHARVHELSTDFDRSQLMPLFALADDSPARIAGYRDQGTLYALLLEQDIEYTEVRSGDIAGLVLVTDAEHDDAPELESVAVRESLHDHGLGAFLVRSVLCRLAASGKTRVCVATAAADVEILSWYQHLGFRLLAVERDWFTPERGYPPNLEQGGIAIRDRVRLDRPLPA